MSFLYLGEEVLRQLEALRRRIEKKTLKKEEFRKVKEEEKNWSKKEITRGNLNITIEFTLDCTKINPE